MTSSLSHCRYWLSSSLSVLRAFCFCSLRCSLVSVWGAGGFRGSCACGVCRAGTLGISMVNENAVAIRARITPGIGTPQLLGRLDSTLGQGTRQSLNLVHFVGLVP